MSDALQNLADSVADGRSDARVLAVVRELSNRLDVVETPAPDATPAASDPAPEV